METGPWHNRPMAPDLQKYDPQRIASIRARLDRPVALIGMMGAGKTRLGKMLAEALGLPFVDSDEEIEKAAGLTIPEIFEKFGEPYFRDGERRVIRRLIEEGGRVISTGGGAILNADTANELWTQTIAVWVRADLNVMLERTARNDRRPLLKNGDPREIMTRLMEARYPIYQQAHIMVESRNGAAEDVLADALEQIDAYLSQSQMRAEI